MIKKRLRKPGIFTDRYVKSLKPEEKMYQVREGRGFAIRVLPSGVKTWYFIYTMNGKRRQLNLGNYPDMSLQNAHEKYRRAFSVVKNGKDPQLPTLVSGVQIIDPKNMTVEILSNRYVDHIENHLVSRSVQQQKRTLCKDVLPVLGMILASEVGRCDAVSLVENIALRAPGQARNVIKTARSMFSYALEREFVEYNPFTGVGRAVPTTAPRARTRTLSEKELCLIWSELIQSHNGRIILLILLTGQRPSEVSGMLRSEIDGSWWTISEVRAKKNDRANRVYLSGIVKSLLPGEVDGEDRVFPAQGRGRGIGANGSTRAGTLSHFLTDNGYFGLPRWTPHDLRRTMATGLAKLGCVDEVIDEILNHKKKGVISVYNQYRYDYEKRYWLVIWSRYMKKIIVGSG